MSPFRHAIAYWLFCSYSSRLLISHNNLRRYTSTRDHSQSNNWQLQQNEFRNYFVVRITTYDINSDYIVLHKLYPCSDSPSATLLACNKTTNWSVRCPKNKQVPIFRTAASPQLLPQLDSRRGLVGHFSDIQLIVVSVVWSWATCLSLSLSLSLVGQRIAADLSGRTRNNVKTEHEILKRFKNRSAVKAVLLL